MLNVYRILCIAGILFSYINGIPRYPIICAVFSLVATTCIFMFVKKNEAELAKPDRSDPKTKKAIMIFAGTLVLHAVIIATLQDKTTEPNQSLQTTNRTVTECAPSRTFRASAIRV
jgi:hypothetical protein